MFIAFESRGIIFSAIFFREESEVNEEAYEAPF